MPITIFDGIVIGVVLFSAVLAMVRGFSREVLSIASWGGSAAAAYYLYHYLVPYAKKYTDDDRIAIVGSAAVVFLIALIVISSITMKIADFIIDSRIGALDRTLGFLFGAARGILLVVVAMLFFNWLVAPQQQPSWVTTAKSKPLLDNLGARLIALLPEDARALLATLAVAGRPMAPKLALRAAGVKRDGRSHVHALRRLNLVRTRDVGGERLLECYHDRVRESVQASLDAEQRRQLHENLLRVLEFSGQAESDWLHTLALGANQREQALHYGLLAAERATATLAFERAAELFQHCLELAPDHAANGGELWAKLALALACCGRGARAAAAFLEAAKYASPDVALTHTRFAASHLIRSGRFDEGEIQVRKVLDAMHIRVPNTERGMLAAIAWELARSRCVIPIPGASRAASVRDSARAVHLDLDARDLEALSR